MTSIDNLAHELTHTVDDKPWRQVIEVVSFDLWADTYSTVYNTIAGKIDSPTWVSVSESVSRCVEAICSELSQ